MRSSIVLKSSCVAVCIRSKVCRTVSENSVDFLLLFRWGSHWCPTICSRDSIDRMFPTSLGLLWVYSRSDGIQSYSKICSLPFFPYRIQPKRWRSRNVFEEDRRTVSFVKHARTLTASLIGLLPLSSLRIKIFQTCGNDCQRFVKFDEKAKNGTFLEWTNNKFWEVSRSISLSE